MTRKLPLIYYSRDCSNVHGTNQKELSVHRQTEPQVIANTYDNNEEIITLLHKKFMLFFLNIWDNTSISSHTPNHFEGKMKNRTAAYSGDSVSLFEDINTYGVQ